MDDKKKADVHVICSKDEQELEEQLEKKCLSRESSKVYAIVLNRFSLPTEESYKLATPQERTERMSRLGLLK